MPRVTIVIETEAIGGEWRAEASAVGDGERRDRPERRRSTAPGGTLPYSPAPTAASVSRPYQFRSFGDRRDGCDPRRPPAATGDAGEDRHDSRDGPTIEAAYIRL